MSRSKNIGRRAGDILRAQTPLYLLGVAIALGLLGEGASKFIDGLLIPKVSPWPGVITFIVGLILLILLILGGDLWRRLRQGLNRLRPVVPTPTMRFTSDVPRRHGLVTLVSSGVDPPAKAAIEHHRQDGTLTHCWLIAGPGEEELSSQKNAERLKAEWTFEDLEPKIISLTSAFDVEEVFRKVQVIYQVALVQKELEVEDLIADYTGGTKPMTMGLVLASVEQGIDLQYTQAEQRDDSGRALEDTPSRPRMIDVGFMDRNGDSGDIDSPSANRD